MSLVAWSPLLRSNRPLIFSILVHPEQKLDVDIYLSLVSDRVQMMLDQS